MKGNSAVKIINGLFIIYILTILTLLIIPIGGSISLSKYIFGFRTDHVIHATMFLPFMSYCWVRNLHRGKLARFLRIYGVGILFAAFCESLHYFIKYRSFDVHDFYANITGLTVGNLIFIFRSPKFSNKN